MDFDMSDLAVGKLKVVQLKAWLADLDVDVPTKAKKQDLIDLVLQNRGGGQREREEEEEEGEEDSDDEAPHSPTSVANPKKMTVPQLIAWLTEHDIEVPAKKQRKSFYVDMVENASKKKKKTAPSTAPSKRSSRARKPVKKASSASPRARRKLLDMPRTASSDDEDVDEDEDDEEEVNVARSSSSSNSSGSSARAAVVMLLVVGVMIAYAYWVYQTLQNGPPASQSTQERTGL